MQVSPRLPEDSDGSLAGGRRKSGISGNTQSESSRGTWSAQKRNKSPQRLLVQLHFLCCQAAAALRAGTFHFDALSGVDRGGIKREVGAGNASTQPAGVDIAQIDLVLWILAHIHRDCGPNVGIVDPTANAVLADDGQGGRGCRRTGRHRGDKAFEFGTVLALDAFYFLGIE